jgi:6-phosphogluconolactonase (cycloisomerase 2 family)
VGRRLVRVPAWHRDLGLDPEQTPEFTSTPGQIGFTPDGQRLVVTTKNGGNSVLVFQAGPGRLQAPVVTSLPGTVPFGFAFDSRGHLALTEAGPSAVATFGVARNGTLTALDTAATSQAATCWVVANDSTVYASNAGSGTLSTYRVGQAGDLTARGTTATDKGTVDAAVSRDGDYLYAQTGAAGVVDAFRIGSDGSLTATGSVTVPDAAGAEGIVAL